MRPIPCTPSRFVDASAIALSLLAAPVTALAHSGHGIELAHLHAHDLTLVLGMIAAFAIVAAYIGRK